MDAFGVKGEKMKISKINWGDDSAEKDPHLLKYFITSDAVERLSSFQKDFIIGRKGSGKSALRTKIKDIFKSYSDQTLIEVLPTYGQIRSITNNQIVNEKFNEPLFFQYFWLSLLYQEAIFALDEKGLVSSTSRAKPLAAEFNRTRRNIPELIANIINRIRLKAGSFGEIGGNIDVTLKQETSVEVLENALKEIIDIGYKITWIVDDLDICWDNSDTANKFILGLTLALNYIKSVSQSLHVIICLREDIYQIILKKYQHSDKLRSVEKIKWSIESLEQLLRERIEYNFTNAGAPIKDAFNKVFPSTVGTSNIMNWLYERTLSRPRELIQLVKLYTESNETEIPNSELMKQAELTYSNWKLDDLCSEYSNEYPGIDRVFTIWKTKYYRNKYHLNKEELDRIGLEIISTANINQEWFELIYNTIDVDSLYRILFKIGFIGDFILGGDGGSKVIYSFNETHDPILNEIQIHPCFRKAVGTVERIR